MKIIPVVLFCLAPIGLQAQFAPSIPVRSTISTPYGNVPYTYYVPGVPIYYGNQQVSFKYPFTVVLNNDSVFTANTRIDVSEKQHVITIKTKGEKTTYEPGQTKEISRILPTGMKLTGIPADSCWLFKANTGNINSYSFVAEESMDNVIAIQKGDGPIVKLTKQNLLAMVGNDPKIQKMIELRKFKKAIQSYNQIQH